MYFLGRLMLITAAGMLVMAAIGIATSSPIMILVGLVCLTSMAAQRLRGGGNMLHAHGTSRWASVADLRRAGMLNATEGLIIGRIMEVSRASLLAGILALFSLRVRSAIACQMVLDALPFRRRVRVQGEIVRLVQGVHSLVIAPPGSGKSSAIVLPFLLDSSDASSYESSSYVVIDPSGELARASAEHKRSQGYRVVILDPAKVYTDTPDSLNPLDFIPADSWLAPDMARALGEAVVIRTGSEPEPHWNDRAEVYISGLIAGVVQFGPKHDRSLQTVSRILADSGLGNAETGQPPGDLVSMIGMMKRSTAWGGILARFGFQMEQSTDKERASTLTSATRHLRALDTPIMIDAVKTSTFDPANSTKEKTAIYLVCSPELIRAQQGWLRIMITALLWGIIRGGPQNERKVHFLLDDAIAILPLRIIDDAIAQFRKHGVRIHLFFQSRGQLREVWPKDQGLTVLSSTSQIYFAVNDTDTAEEVSKKLGEYTQIVMSGGRTWGGGRNRPDYSGSHSPGSSSTNWGGSENWQMAPRRLLKPEEIAQLPSNPHTGVTAITFTPGVPPIMTTLRPYFLERKVSDKLSLGRRIMRSLRMLVICFVVMMLSLLLLRLASEMVTPSAQYPAPDMPWQGQPGGLRQSPWNGNQKYLEPF